jgi:hypothetical protein
MRFSIRDLLWATLVVAMGLGWWVSHRALDAERVEAVEGCRTRDLKIHTLTTQVRNFQAFHAKPRRLNVSEE